VLCYTGLFLPLEAFLPLSTALAGAVPAVPPGLFGTTLRRCGAAALACCLVLALLLPPGVPGCEVPPVPRCRFLPPALQAPVPRLAPPAIQPVGAQAQ
jgi:hypothetical protein